MSIEQSNNFRKLRFLLAQLKTFGLNPYEWTISRRDIYDGVLVMNHKYDREFSLLGHLTADQKTGNLCWTSLAVRSL